MLTFATEFPISGNPNDGQIVSTVVEWLRGINGSSVLNNLNPESLDLEYPVISAANGEELRLRKLNDGHIQAIGFRHDFYDLDSRLWRTEMVLKRGLASQDIIRFRTQCIANKIGARIETPKKPFLIKSLMQYEWGGMDGIFTVKDTPTYLDSNEIDLVKADKVIKGTGSRFLPIVYISAYNNDGWSYNQDYINKLAYDLGGIAHVVVEPTRTFSFELRDISNGKNVYGGAIGIFIPNYGHLRKFIINYNLNDIKSVISSVKIAAIHFRSQMPAEGWDWTELQEQAFRQQRERFRKNLNQQEIQSLYEEEIASLKDQIVQLKYIKSQVTDIYNNLSDDKTLNNAIKSCIGPEIYPGEFIDRIRLAASLATKYGESEGIDMRSRAMFEGMSKLDFTDGLLELMEDLKRATKDPSRLSSQLPSLLCRHGYTIKSQNKHLRLEPGVEFTGLKSITIPTTPSDFRASKNARSDTEQALCIKGLKS